MNPHGVEEPGLLWRPSEALNRDSVFSAYLDWLRRTRGIELQGYWETWEWSTTDLEGFWGSLWEFFDVQTYLPYSAVLAERRMPGARWFPGAELNYAERALAHAGRGGPALLFRSETRPLQAMDWSELRRQVASVAAALREMGVGRGDRVAAYLPNLPQAVVALLACASLGAIWSSCSPDFGTQGVVERFRQIEPRVLIAVDGYRYAGKRLERLREVEELRRALPTVENVVLVPNLDPHASLEGARPWAELLEHDAQLRFEPVPFDHPLWILYSSGTTGIPKAIVHGHGGIVLEHLKSLALQNNLKPGDRFFWFTTTGWMMWNLLVGGLLAGCTIVLYDGSPAHPDLEVLWRLAEEARVTRFGASAAYFTACMKAGLRPGDRSDLASVRAIGSTGSPLAPEGFQWVYDAVKRDVWLASSSGGTDVCSAFLGGCPTLPVYAGELQGPALGVRARAFDERGREVVGRVGELVITEPMPSMPTRFWNDPQGARYRESYFEMYPGVWRHGDWVRFTRRGSAVILGRSDSTLNRMGVRIGTGEIYRAVESLAEVVDSLVVGVELPGGGYHMPLFVALREGVTLDEPLRARIRQEIRSRFSPRHVPDEIVQVAALPRTLSGKKLEVPVKKILLGHPVSAVVSPGTLTDAAALGFFERYAEALRARAGD